MTVTQDSAAEDETLPEAAPGAGDCPSNSPAPQAAAAQGQDDEDRQAKQEEEAVSGKTEEQQKMPDQKEEEKGAPTVETGTINPLYFRKLGKCVGTADVNLL